MELGQFCSNDFEEKKEEISLYIYFHSFFFFKEKDEN